MSSSENLNRFRTTQSGGILSALLGLFGLVGWVFNVPSLSTFGLTYIPMAPSTALLFLLFGALVAIEGTSWIRFKSRWGFRSLAALGTFVAFVLFLFSIRGHYHPVESLGLSLNVPIQHIPVGHMSSITAALFVFSGLSLLFFRPRGKRHKWSFALGLGPSLLVFLSGSALVLAYLMGSPAFYGSLTIPPALPTSIGFFFLGGSLLAYFAHVFWVYPFRVLSKHRRPIVSLILLFLLLASGIVLVGHHNHRSYARQFRSETEVMLQAIGTFKAKELANWRKERHDDAAFFYRNPGISQLVQSKIQDPGNIETDRALKETLKLIHASQNYDLFSIFTLDGKEVLSFPEGKTPVSAAILDEVSHLAASGVIGFHDLYRNEYDRRLFMSMVVPVFDAPASDSVIAALVLRIDPELYLFPMISLWPGSGETGETLIVRQEGDEVVYLNTLRFGENTALNLRLNVDSADELPAALAVNGVTGIVEGIDYRGVPVYASLHPVPDSPWYLVARMDRAEVYEPLGQHLQNSIVLMLLLIGLTGFGVFLGWRQQQVGFLKEKMVAAEASDRLKTAFMNNISHELRTPLNCILGFGQVMARPGISEDSKKEFLGMIQDSSDRLLSTVNNYMDMSLIASGNLDAHPMPYDVTILLNELYQEFQTKCIAKDLALSIQSGAAGKIIHTSDPELIKKAMVLLLDNALKFTHKGSIEFGVSIADDQRPGFFVKDTGIGISKKSIHHLYEPYWQEEVGPTSHYEGSGLGLPIVKGIIDKLEGRIHVDTEKGRGTTISFDLPGPVEVEEAEAEEKAGIKGPGVQNSPLVLIAEDDDNNAQYYAFALEQAACKLIFAVNGQEAVDMVQLHPDISLVLMDLKMPVMNGFDATRIIKGLRKNLPVVATTAYAMTHDERRAREAGCDDYLAKPIRPAMLTDTLRKYGVIARNSSTPN